MWCWCTFVVCQWFLKTRNTGGLEKTKQNIVFFPNCFISKKYRVSQKKIVFRNLVLFWLAGVWAFKIWVILGSKNIHAITRCLALVPNVSTLVCTPLSLYTPLNGHLIRGFAIFLKTILFWDTLYLFTCYNYLRTHLYSTSFKDNTDWCDKSWFTNMWGRYIRIWTIGKTSKMDQEDSKRSL